MLNDWLWLWLKPNSFQACDALWLVSVPGIFYLWAVVHYMSVSWAQNSYAMCWLMQTCRKHLFGLTTSRLVVLLGYGANHDINPAVATHSMESKPFSPLHSFSHGLLFLSHLKYLLFYCPALLRIVCVEPSWKEIPNARNGLNCCDRVSQQSIVVSWNELGSCLWSHFGEGLCPQGSDWYFVVQTWKPS